MPPSPIAAPSPAGRRKTIVVDDGPGTAPPPGPAAAAPSTRRRNKTDVWEDGDAGGPRGKSEGRGRLLGVLVSFSANPSGEMWPVRKGRTTLGNDTAADVVLNYDGISRAHATIVSRPGVVWISDNDSTNGTFVNGVDVLDEKVRLGQGDVLKIGPIAMTLMLVPDSPD
ncbi:MAG: FHA domain-containing protein [Proteobacteria bacterium]|nr:FHA domain-containing protein [Pseudomonadota bacterium]